MKYIKILILLISFEYILFAENLIPPPYNKENPEINASYYRNEGFRAASFGSNIIARDLFYKSCVLGDQLGCNALSEIDASLRIDSVVTKKDECYLGDKDACFNIYQYYSNEGILDSFKVTWYLSKACRLGHKKACNIKREQNYIFIKNERQVLSTQCFRDDVLACYKLANIYLFGDGVKRNINLTMNLLAKSCNGGLKKACIKYNQIISLK
ncbi:sel1 repeat family protein [Helicobacter sp. MIT 99-5507]|uniref:sel1 repeat family protein n=1 Tax=Helicobacter sp. MIT 99-5507 TaxID=152489 RepID=UPI000E1E3C5F|nr:sel1 repeat family protein [Helicobacter sp. MIT 99-5507]RDU57470.1 hypothetical protein CQA42_05985 [Helicobacter sp. MIT 99-5507]